MNPRARYFIVGPSGRNAQSHHIRQMLGLADNAKLPIEGMPKRSIQGITVWVEPLESRPSGMRYRRSDHRVLAQCPGCNKILSAGRLHQHVCPETCV